VPVDEHAATAMGDETWLRRKAQEQVNGAGGTFSTRAEERWLTWPESGTGRKGMPMSRVWNETVTVPSPPTTGWGTMLPSASW
jgi:hypothetical protein